MTTMEQPPQKSRGSWSRELMTLVIALLALVYLVINLSSCGSEDLTVPGSIPFTPVPDATDTPDPEENL